jgi:hypothetical protein
MELCIVMEFADGGDLAGEVGTRAWSRSNSILVLQLLQLLLLLHRVQRLLRA